MFVIKIDEETLFEATQLAAAENSAYGIREKRLETVLWLLKINS